MNPNRTRTLWLAIGIPVTVILLLSVAVVAVLAWAGLFTSGDINANATLDGAKSVSVTAPNARVDLLSGTDDQIHVTMTGTYTGPPPTLTTSVNGGAAHIDIETSNRWLTRNDLTLTVTLPAHLDITVDGINGHITLSGLTGNIRLETVNGDIDATGMSGQLDLVTVNGRINLQHSTSHSVKAGTVNGTVELGFTVAPSAVTATSVNGAITVSVPDDGARYAVSASTVLGKIDTGNISTDPSAEHTITAETVNGSITVTTVSR